MTRSLPWLKRPKPSTPQATGSPRKVAPRAKRHRVEQASSDVDEDNGGTLEKDVKATMAPTPEPLLESSMEEGLDNDDRFRMVEDEFLDVAKLFTRHLHAAEYQRLKKAARSQNAVVINSISRPVSIKMPDETRRKVESVARAKKQVGAVNGLLKGKCHRLGSDEDSDGSGGAWLGTALHGLMENPLKSAASLKHIGKTPNSIRTTVDYDKSCSRKSFGDSPLPSPDLELLKANSKIDIPRKRDHSETTDEDDDADDLDAPVRPRSHITSNGPTTVLAIKSDHHGIEPKRGNMTSRDTKSAVYEGFCLKVQDDSMGGISSSVSTAARQRISKRLEQTKTRQAQGKQEACKKLEIIPMFLS